MKKILSYLIVFGVILATCITIGCRPSPTTDTLTMTRKATALEVESTFTNNIYLMRSIIQSDENFLIPKKAWVDQVFKYKVSDFLKANNVTIALDASDCNKLANYGKVVAELYYDHGNQKLDNGNIACGVFSFMYFDFRVHVINFFVVENEQGKLEVIFFDPSIGKVIEYDNESNTGLTATM